jgi:CBS domain-containing protein
MRVPKNEGVLVRPIHRMLRWRYQGQHPVRTSPMRVASILSIARERLVTVQADALLTEAAKLLCGTHRALLVVCDVKGTMVGVITKTDVVRRVARSYGTLSDARVADVMTAVVTYCKQGDSLHDVLALMHLLAGAPGRSGGRRTASPRIRHGCRLQVAGRGAIRS